MKILVHSTSRWNAKVNLTPSRRMPSLTRHENYHQLRYMPAGRQHDGILNLPPSLIVFCLHLKIATYVALFMHMLLSTEDSTGSCEALWFSF